MGRRRRTCLAACLLLAALPLTGAPVPERLTPHPDAPEETAQFAFLIGAWDCKTRFMLPDGSWNEGRARWTGEYILDGWAIQDTWVSPLPEGGRFMGTNIRSFNPRTGKWDNRWLPQGTLEWKHYEAERRGESMVMTGGEGEDARGAYIDRNTFHDIGENAWKWRKDRSYDGGESWVEGVGFIEATRIRER